MKLVYILVAVMLLGGCSDKNDEADGKRQKKLQDMYKTPPKSDRSKEKGF